jgi:hypothetical protein
MALSDPDFYRKALGRVKKLIVIIGLAASIALCAWKGIRYGGGFLAGAAASYFSFWRWEQVVQSLTAARATAPPSSWRFAIRILVLLAVSYVIIVYSGVNRTAALAGLLTPAAAATIEIVYELIWNLK